MYRRAAALSAAAWLLLCLLCATRPAATAAEDGADTRTPVVSVVLVGAMGNLAKKYLWQALFRLSSEHRRGVGGRAQPKLLVWPGSRAPLQKGQDTVTTLLNGRGPDRQSEALRCVEGVDYILPGELHECVSAHQHFKAHNVMPYTQLKRPEHYADLEANIRQYTDAHNHYEAGRIVYLSIPPKAYENVSAAVAEHAHPYSRLGEGGISVPAGLRPPFLRVIFEKPFGSDLESAEAMSMGIGSALQEAEIYRIDHYLGKAGVRVLQQFRAANRDTYEPLFNKEHVERVEVAMKEQEDCAGRAGYYDDYGVVRDLHQNHLSEMLALATMDLPEFDDGGDPTARGTEGDGSAPPAHEGDASDAEGRRAMLAQEVAMFKSYLYDAVVPPTLADAVLGQYTDYQAHVEEDRAKWMQDEAQIRARTHTATFAAVRVRVDTPRWEGVPIVVISGKALEERTAYVRFIFKNGGELVFNVQGGAAGTSVSATSDLPAFAPVEGWSGTTHLITPNDNPGAYDTLVAAAWNEETEHFVATDTLLGSWRVWSPLLREMDALETAPPAYGPGGAAAYARASRLFRDAPKEL